MAGIHLVRGVGVEEGQGRGGVGVHLTLFTFLEMAIRRGSRRRRGGEEGKRRERGRGEKKEYND